MGLGSVVGEGWIAERAVCVRRLGLETAGGDTGVRCDPLFNSTPLTSSLARAHPCIRLDRGAHRPGVVGVPTTRGTLLAASY